MILLIHLCAAIASLIGATLALVSPAIIRIKLCYFLVSITLLSGTYLVISQRAHILSACLSGLIYVGLVFGLLAGAKLRLVSAKEKID
jgi:hypothetical protein